MKLQVKKLTSEAFIPTRNHKFDAGLDLYSIEDVFLELGSTNKIKTGISMDVPEGYYAKIEDRSGCAARGLRTGAGVVDHGFHGELVVVMHNLTNRDEIVHTGPFERSKIGYWVKAGDRIAQIIIQRIELPEVEQVEWFNLSDRDEKSFGSSGR